MAKVMLVEDDNNLREIYEARLAAEGYEIIAAKDGEEALAMAVKEKPNLILCDVMMPKISGFDMLDILRSTDGIKDTKVIMMTALSQAEDKVRANKLGADRYLVKSQVTLEDMAKMVHDVLEGTDTATATPPQPSPAADVPNIAAAPQAPAAATTPTPGIVPVAISAVANAANDVDTNGPDEDAPAGIASPASVGIVGEEPAASSNTSTSQPSTDQPSTATAPAANTIPTQADASSSEPPNNATPISITSDDTPAGIVSANSFAQDPTSASSNTSATPEASAAGNYNVAVDQLSQSAASEEAIIQNQIENFVAQQGQTSPTSSATSYDTTPRTSTTSSGSETPQNDGVTVKGKKMIQPPDAVSSGKPSLDELLAKEDAKTPIDITPIIVSANDAPKPAAADSTPVEPHPPGHVITPPITTEGSST